MGRKGLNSRSVVTVVDVKTVLVEAAGVIVEVEVEVIVVTAMDGIVEVTSIVMVVLSTSRTLSKRYVSFAYIMYMGERSRTSI
jgi:hypothetical protein